MIPFQRKSFDFKSEPYGLIHVDAFTEEPIFNLAEEYHQFVNANPRDVISTFADKMCSIDGQPIKSKLTNGIPPDLLDLFSDKFIENNSWITDTSKSHGQRVALKKKEAETSSDYLYRIICAYYNSTKDSIEKMGEEIHKIFKDSFLSKEVEESLKKNAEAVQSVMKQLASIDGSYCKSEKDSLAKMASEMKNNLKECFPSKEVEESFKKNAELSQTAMKQLSSAKTPSFDEPSSHMFRNLLIPENPIIKTNKKLEDISDDFSNVKLLVKSMAELLTSMNDLGKNMAIEFKNSAKISARYNFWMMLIAIITLAATLVFTIINYRSSENTNKIVLELLKGTKTNETAILNHLDQNSINQKVLMDRILLLNDSSSKK